MTSMKQKENKEEMRKRMVVRWLRSPSGDLSRLGPAAANNVNVHFHEFLSLDCTCTHFISLRVCMDCNSHNNIWRSPPRDTLRCFQNSSLSDNKMTKSGIISLVMYRVSGCTQTNSFHTRRSCLLVLYCALMLFIWQQLGGWMNSEQVGFVHTCAMCWACCPGICRLHGWPAAWIDTWWSRWLGWMGDFSVHGLMLYWEPEESFLTTAATQAACITLIVPQTVWKSHAWFMPLLNRHRWYSAA